MTEKEDISNSTDFEKYFNENDYKIDDESNLLYLKAKQELNPEIEVRDFAFLTNDPRHWGLKVEPSGNDDSDVSSEENDSEIDFSSFSQWDNDFCIPFVDIDVDKFLNTVKIEKIIQLIFEKQRMDKENENLNDKKRYSHSSYNSDETKEKINLENMKLKIYHAISLFDFRKVTEWEMSINEGEDIYLVTIEDPEDEDEDEIKSENEIENKNSNKDENENKKNNTSVNENENNKEKNEIKIDDKEKNNLEKEKENNEKIGSNGSEESNNDVEKLKGNDSNNADESTDRIGSIDELYDDEEKSVNPFELLSQKYKFPHPVMIDIRPIEFYSELLQYIDYSSVYGNGWVLGMKVKVRCRRRFKNKKRLRKNRPIKLKLRVIDVGLIPENYIELYSHNQENEEENNINEDEDVNIKDNINIDENNNNINNEAITVKENDDK